LTEPAVHAVKRGRGIELGAIDGCRLSDKKESFGPRHWVARTTGSVERHMERIYVRQPQGLRTNLYRGK
jgi:hypothetical protein